MSQPPRINHLVGIGLDNKDGHKRLTQAENFAIVGGSQETHERMTETLIKTVEDLKIRRKSLQTASLEELKDLLNKNLPRP